MADSVNLTLADDVIQNNFAAGNNGGAVEIRSTFNTSSLTLTDDTISGNSGLSNGGAIDGPTGNVTITGSTFDGNSANDGGAVSLGTNAVVDITNSTFADNTAADQGGAIFDGFNAAYNLLNDTITANSAGNVGGGVSLVNGTVAAQNTIIAGNSADFNPDVTGDFNSLGANLIGITDGSSGFGDGDFTGTGDAPLDPQARPARRQRRSDANHPAAVRQSRPRRRQ